MGPRTSKITDPNPTGISSRNPGRTNNKTKVKRDNSKTKVKTNEFVGCYSTDDEEDIPSVPVSFKYIDRDASTVFLAGTFTEWDLHPIRLRKDRDGNWSRKLELEPGEYNFKFIVDTEWTVNPSLPTCPDAFGDITNYIVVKPPRLSFSQKFFTDEEIKNAEPLELPSELTVSVLNVNTDTTDKSLMALPNHVTLRHCYTRPKRLDLMVTGCSERVNSKYVSTVFYSNISSTCKERRFVRQQERAARRKKLKALNLPLPEVPLPKFALDGTVKRKNLPTGVSIRYPRKVTSESSDSLAKQDQ
ncbi:hypothetical protein PCE1_004328 [Barthelona sp. PCE]